MSGAGAEIEFRLQPVPPAPEMEALWRGLETSGSGSFFTSWTWIGAWLESLPAHIRPLLLTAQANGAVIAATIAAERERRRLLGKARQLYLNATGKPEPDSITIEHNGFIVRPEAAAALWPAFLRWFAEQSDFDELILPGIPKGTFGSQAIPAGLLRDETISSAFACILPPDSGREAILAGLSSNARQQLRRNLRALERLGPLSCERADTVETALAWFNALKRFHTVSWMRRGKPHAFRYPFFDAFHRRVIVRGVPDGSVDVLRISAGGAPLGCLYNFRSGGCVTQYQSGFDDAKQDLRPGYISHLLAMERAVRAGATRYDFLAGGNQLKRTFANETYGMSTWRFTRPSAVAGFEAAARAVARRLKGRA